MNKEQADKAEEIAAGAAEAPAFGGDMSADGKMRRCLVSKRAGAAEAMIRFCADPQGQVVPDIKGNLPGRGAWVFGRHAYVAEAVKRKIFAHALKKQVQTPPDLAELVDKLLLRAALANLSLARRSGAVITGAGKIDSVLRGGGNVAMLLHAAEAAQDSRRKLAQAAYAGDFAAAKTDAGEADKQKKGRAGAKILSPFTAEELQSAFGEHNVIHIAVLKNRGAKAFIKAAERLLAYRAPLEEAERQQMKRSGGQIQTNI